MVTYEQWNRAIISYFFDNCEPGQVVFLQTNTEMLTEIAEQCELSVEDAPVSLTTAVQHKALPYGRVNLWGIRPTDLWELYPEVEPPQVAFLALTVLAASLMESSDEVFHTNYYARLNQLLFGKLDTGKPEGLEYRQFEGYWLHLQRWASHQCDVELHLTTGPAKRRYVWYPISQCLICNNDRRSLYEFFHDNRLHPFSNLADKELETKLHYSASTFSAKIRRHLDREYYAQSIVSQVQSLLKAWDGQVPSEQPRDSSRRMHSVIAVELRFDPSGNAEVRYWFPRRGREYIKLQPNTLEISSLKSFESKDWFQPIQDAQCTFWNLRGSHQLRTDEGNPVTYTLNPSDIWVFRQDPERDDGWLSQRNLQLHEDHLILFRKRLAERVTACLGECCGEHLDSSNAIHINHREDEWFYLRVRPTILRKSPDPELWRLSVESGKHIRFVDGLAAKDPDGHRAYFSICLPRVLVSDLGLPSSELLHVGEQTFAVDADRFVKLDNGLGAGIHLLSYGSKKAKLPVGTVERSLDHQERSLVTDLSQETTAMPTYSDQAIAPITAQPGVWLAGARFMGQDVPKVTWNDMQVEPEPVNREPPQPFRSPAEIISLTVKAAIELKQDRASVPEWLEQVITWLNQNIALRVSVEKKLSHYGKIALTYQELCQLGAINHESQTIP